MRFKLNYIVALLLIGIILGGCSKKQIDEEHNSVNKPGEVKIELQQDITQSDLNHLKNFYDNTYEYIVQAMGNVISTGDLTNISEADIREYAKASDLIKEKLQSMEGISLMSRITGSHIGFMTLISEAESIDQVAIEDLITILNQINNEGNKLIHKGVQVENLDELIEYVNNAG